MPSASSIKAGAAHVTVSGDTKPLESALDRARSKLLSVGKMMAIAGGGLMAGGTATLGALTGTFLKFTNHANEISRLATKLGTSTEQLSEFAYAAQTTGLSFEDLTGQFENLAERVAQGAAGTGEAAETFKRLGIDAAQLKLKNPIDQMIELARAMQGVTNQTDRLGMLSSLGGDQFQWMENLFSKGPEGIAALMGEAKRVGASLSGQEAQQAQRAGQAIDRAWTAAKNAVMRVGAALLPTGETLERISAAIVDGAIKLREFIDENKALVMSIGAGAAAMLAVGGALVGIGATISAMAPAFSVISTVASALVALPGLLVGIPAVIGSAIAALPGLIVGATVFAAKLAVVSAAVAGIGYGLYYIATQTEFGQSILDGVLDAGGAVLNYLRDIATQVRDAVLTIVAPLMDTWGDIKASFASGDLAGALKLTVAALKVSWAEFMIYFTEGWNRVERWFSETWLEIQYQFEIAWIKIKAIVNTLGETFKPQIDFVKSLFRGLVDIMVGNLKIVGGVIYLAFVKPLENMLDLMARAARAIGRSELANSLEGIVRNKLDWAKDFAAEMERSVEMESRKAVEAIETEKQMKLQIAQAEREAKAAQRQEDRKAADERLVALRAELAAKRAVVNGPVPNPKIDQVVAAAKAYEYTVRGAFDARNARQAFAGNAAVEEARKQLEAQADANRLLEKIIGQIEQLRIVWG